MLDLIILSLVLILVLENPKRRTAAAKLTQSLSKQIKGMF